MSSCLWRSWDGWRAFGQCGGILVTRAFEYPGMFHFLGNGSEIDDPIGLCDHVVTFGWLLIPLIVDYIVSGD